MRVSALRKVLGKARGSFKWARKSARRAKPKKDWVLAGRNYARKELKIP